MFVDSFSGSLDDIPAKHQRDLFYVLSVLKAKPVFSAFDINTNALAKTVADLHGFGFMKYRQDREYPWNEIVITEKGNEFLAIFSSPQPTAHGA